MSLGRIDRASRLVVAQQYTCIALARLGLTRLLPLESRLGIDRRLQGRGGRCIRRVGRRGTSGLVRRRHRGPIRCKRSARCQGFTGQRVRVYDTSAFDLRVALRLGIGRYLANQSAIPKL